MYKNKVKKVCRKIKCVCVCVNFDFIEFGGMTQRKFWYGLWCHSTLFTIALYIFNHCNVFGQQRNRNRRKTQNKLGLLRRSRSSKVIEVSRPTNRKPVCDFLLVINWHPISYRFGDIAAYCSNFGYFAFLSHPFGGLGTTYDVDLGLLEIA